MRPELIEKSLKVSMALIIMMHDFSRDMYHPLVGSIFLSSFILLAKVSAAIIKRYADRGQPCLMPRVGENHSNIYPLFKIVDWISSVYIILTHFQKFGHKIKKFHSIVDKIPVDQIKCYFKVNCQYYTR